MSVKNVSVNAISTSVKSAKEPVRTLAIVKFVNVSAIAQDATMKDAANVPLMIIPNVNIAIMVKCKLLL